MIQIHCTDTVRYAKNAAFEVHSNFGGAYIKFVNKKGEGRSIPVKCKTISTDSIVIHPKECFTRSEFDGRIRFAFNGIPFNDKAATLEFKTGDSVYVYIIPVEKLEQNNEGNKVKVVDADPKKGNGLAVVYDIEDASEVTSGVIHVRPKGKSVVVLKSAKGLPTNDTLYTPTHGIKVGNKDTGWYSYSCEHGDVCVIEIRNRKVPKDPENVISIPLQNTDKSFEIKVIRK